MQTWNTCFGEGYMIISSYDETQNEMFGKLRAETKDIGDNACKTINFRRKLPSYSRKTPINSLL